MHGSVLFHRGVIYAAAGRSSYLDGGIMLYGLDPPPVWDGMAAAEGRLFIPCTDGSLVSLASHKPEGLPAIGSEEMQ